MCVTMTRLAPIAEMLAQCGEREMRADRPVVDVTLTNKQVGAAGGLDQGFGPLGIAGVAYDAYRRRGRAGQGKARRDRHGAHEMA